MKSSSCFLSVAQAIVVLLLHLVAAVSPMQGQSGDIRLSYDPWQPVLPAEVLIQSGAQAGDWSLVVFGTTERVGDSAVPILVMQLLKDTVLSGPQQKLTSDEARPSGYVQVVATDGRFLVFWKDRRAVGVGVWMRTVDTAGKLGAEQEFRDWPFPEQGAMVLDVGGKRRLLWNDTSSAGGIRTQGIDSLGYPSSDFNYLDSGRASGVMGPFVNGVTAVLRVNDLPLLIDSSGQKIGVGSWANKFADKWHLSRDGVVTTVRGDTILRLYRNVLDTVAERVIRFVLPKPDQGGISPNSVCPYRDEDDSLFVIYATGGGEGNMSKLIRFSAVKAHLNLDGKVSATIILTTRIYETIIPWMITHMNPINTNTILWDGFSRIFLVHYHVNWNCIKKGEYGSHEKVLLYVLNKDESIITDSTEIIKYQKKQLSIFNETKIAQRIVGIDHWMSNVELSLNGKVILLSSQSAILRKNITEEEPALTINKDQISVGWLSQGIDTTIELVLWGRQTDTLIASQSILTSEPLIGRSVMQAGDRFVVGSVYQWVEKTLQGDSVRRRCNLRFPTDTGWTEPVSIDSNASNINVQLLAWTQHPETKEFLIQFGFAGEVITHTFEKTVISFDLDGNQKWRISNPSTSAIFPSLIPISDSLFFLISKQDVRLQTHDSLIRFQKIPPDDFYSAIRLLGSYFLRWTAKGVLQRFSFTVDGTVQLVDTATIQRGSTEFNEIYIVQNPQDSGLAIILTSAKNGVWMLTMNKHLRQVTPLTRIGGSDTLTTTPRAIFKEDSLFVVWIDHRNGVVDVYGTVVVPQTALSVKDQSVAEAQGFRIIPNPANRRATVQLSRATTAERTIVLHDVTGRELRRVVIASGESDEVIDLAGIASGTYLLTVLGEGRGELLIVQE